MEKMQKNAKKLNYIITYIPITTNKFKVQSANGVFWQSIYAEN